MTESIKESIIYLNAIIRVIMWEAVVYTTSHMIYIKSDSYESYLYSSFEGWAWNLFLGSNNGLSL